MPGQQVFMGISLQDNTAHFNARPCAVVKHCRQEAVENIAEKYALQLA
jgi:hypothetical protein